MPKAIRIKGDIFFILLLLYFVHCQNECELCYRRTILIVLSKQPNIEEILVTKFLSLVLKIFRLSLISQENSKRGCEKKRSGSLWCEECEGMKSFKILQIRPERMKNKEVKAGYQMNMPLVKTQLQKMHSIINTLIFSCTFWFSEN